MRIQCHGCIWSVVALVAMTGCDSSATGGSAGGPSMEQLAAKLPGKTDTPAATAAADASTAGQVANDESMSAAGRGAAAADPSVVPPDAKKASDRGPVASRSGTYLGAISAANRNIRNRLDDLPWKDSVRLFQAEMGYKPKDTKEFMERINRDGVQLPDIPAGTTYLYVPDDGQFGELYQVPIDEGKGETPPGR